MREKLVKNVTFYTFDTYNQYNKNVENMTTLEKKHGYTLEFNGSTTYFINDSTGTCVGRKDTERKARNTFNRILSNAGLV